MHDPITDVTEYQLMTLFYKTKGRRSNDYNCYAEAVDPPVIVKNNSLTMVNFKVSYTCTETVQQFIDKHNEETHFFYADDASNSSDKNAIQKVYLIANPDKQMIWRWFFNSGICYLSAMLFLNWLYLFILVSVVDFVDIDIERKVEHVVVD